MNATGAGLGAREEFIERIGLLAQGEGLPRIAGRLFATLVFDGERLSFGDLAEKLQVSRGSISSSVRLLEERDLIKRVAKPGDRQDYFQLADDPFGALLRLSAQRAERAAGEIRSTLRVLSDDADGPRRRLQAYADFYAAIESCLSGAARDLQKQL